MSDKSKPNYPKIGDMVHYRPHGSSTNDYKPICRPAIVTETFDPIVTDGGKVSLLVSLFVMTPNGSFSLECEMDETAKTGDTWHWPFDEHIKRS